MNRFSDFKIDTSEDKKIFQVPKISIEDVLNSEIEIIDFETSVKTQYGEGRYILKIRYNGNECKMFTNASPIKEALSQINKDDLPFMTIIRQQKFGNGSKKTFHFT